MNYYAIFAKKKVHHFVSAVFNFKALFLDFIKIEYDTCRTMFVM